MAKRPKHSEAETLEQYRIALTNAEVQPEIAAVMAELGYDATLIGKGKNLLTETRKAYDANKIEDDETSVVYSKFVAKREQIENIYNLDRKKAKVVFRNDPVNSDKLAISGTMPRTYIKWLEIVKKFYELASADTDIQTKLARLKITADDLIATKALIVDLDNLRAEYLKEKGESQEATKTKDVAFAKIDDWMSEFYAVAKIGLEDKPQLLESLGKLVKN